MNLSPSRRRASVLLRLIGLTLLAALPARAETGGMKEKIVGSLQETFRFDPDAARPAVLDEDGVVLMEPLVVREKSLPRGLETAVAEERIQLSTTFSLREGGELLKDLPGGVTL